MAKRFYSFQFGCFCWQCELMIDSIAFTGAQISYFFICKRKLWLFSNNLNMEHCSDLVSTGRFVHESSFMRKNKEIQIGRIKIDFFEKGGEIHEVKKSRKAEKAHEFQLLYYLYYLKQLGLTDLKGVIDYPLIRKRKTIVLTREKEQELLNVLKGLNRTKIGLKFNSV